MGDSSVDLINFLRSTYPATGPDLAKLLFWTFVAGFSERFVPQILQQREQSTTEPKK